MRTTAILAFALAAVSSALLAQETKPVPKDSLRVVLPGCTKGYVFTAGRRTVEEAGSIDVPEGMHFRMNGPKKTIAELKAHEGSKIEITGIIKKGQYGPEGVGVGGGVRITPGPQPGSGGVSGIGTPSQNFIDVEGWRAIEGRCPSR